MENIEKRSLKNFLLSNKKILVSIGIIFILLLVFIWWSESTSKKKKIY